MDSGLRISVVDTDPDYLGIEVRAASGRFAGTTFVYAGFDELSTFATRIEGFPKTPRDERKHEFGSTDPRIAGGFAGLRFYCVDGSGHAALEVEIMDDDPLFDPASAKLGFKIAAADIDRFAKGLRDVERERSGAATLPAAI